MATDLPSTERMTDDDMVARNYLFLLSEEKVLNYCHFRSMHIPGSGLRHYEVGLIGSS